MPPNKKVMSKLIYILKQPEGRKLEFKETIPSNTELAKTIISFANDAGGELYLGIKDNPREVVGVDENMLINLEEKISNIIHDHCKPVILPEITFITHEDKHIIKTVIYRGSNPPYYLKNKGIRDGTYTRVGSSNRLASAEMIAELERRKRNISFDSEPSYDKTADQLKFDSFRELFFEKAGEKLTAQVIRKLHLVKTEQNRILPTNAFILLSDDELKNRHFPYAKIECARFKGTIPGNFIDQKSIDVSLCQQSEYAYQFVLRHISEGSVDYSGVYRTDRWEYPVIAIREVIRNAVIHRDYSLAGKDIKVAIFDDKIEITSPGVLPATIDYNDMLSGQSDIRNKTLAPVFKRMGIIEQWGNGLRLIADEMQKYPDIRLEWNEPGLAFRVTFIKKNYVEAIVDDQVNDQVNDQVISILRFCSTPKSRGEILKNLGYKNHFDNYKRHIKPVLDNNLIEMTIPDKPKSKNQKYRLTIKGNEYKKIGRTG